MEKVGLTPAEYLYRKYPREISGGQCQRVVLVRALITGPEFIVADEPIAMADVSVLARLSRSQQPTSTVQILILQRSAWDERLQLLQISGAGLQLLAVEPAKEFYHRLVHRRGQPELLSLPHDVTVELLQLGAPALHHILK